MPDVLATGLLARAALTVRRLVGIVPPAIGATRSRSGPPRFAPTDKRLMPNSMLLAAKPVRTAAGPRFGTLPSHMRVLFVSTSQRRGAWLTAAFATDSAVEVTVEEVTGMTAGMARLREEMFDAVLVSHEPSVLDALDFAEALRGGGSEEPLVLLGEQSEQETSPLAYEAGADAYVCVNTTTTRSLIWILSRAVERHRLIREHRRLVQAEQHRLQSEHSETQRLLDEQRSLLRDLESFVPKTTCDAAAADDSSGASAGSLQTSAPLDLPPTLIAHYHELMRSYVIMGSGNLGDDMGRIAELMADAGITAPETMQLHVCVLEAMVQSLGARSARHVMARADLLILEVMVHLSEVYRRRYLERRHPPQQLLLPGFDFTAANDAA
jgi:DNA-binding NarL/FixJ family response regulator